MTLDRFESGGGTRYADYRRFHQVMAEDSDLGAAGFRSIDCHVLPHDAMNVWFFARRE